MRKVVSLYLPTWSTDRVRRSRGKSAPPVDAPLILIGRNGNKRIVTCADGTAQRLGIRAGMAASKAQALIPNLHILDADQEADEAALNRLALWAVKLYSPIVAVDRDGLFLDVSGAGHRYGGDAGMLADIVRRVTEAGIDARVALAPTFGAAFALARFTRGGFPIVGEDQLVTAIEPLPIAALRMPSDIVSGLRAQGFKRIGELNATPRAPLALRFGSEVGRRLDQIYGRAGEQVIPVEAPDLISVRQSFAEPIAAAETLTRYIGKLAGLLVQALEVKGLGAVRLDLLFHRVDNGLEAIRVGMAKPMRDARRIARLLCDKLENVDPGFGVEKMVLSAPFAEALEIKQVATSLGEKPLPDIAELIDTLANRLGPGRLFQAAPLESDVPERSVSRVAPLGGGTMGWPSHWPRPTRLLSAPESIETMALMPDHPPAAFTWRGVRRRVRCADGPERIFGEWWKHDAEMEAVRDYFQVEDEEGQRYWLFRAGDGESEASGSQRWFMHGIFG